MRLVMASTMAFLAALLLNLGGTIYVALFASTPAFPESFDHKLLLLSAWGFLVVTVWGFNARWLPVFLGLRKPQSRGLMRALAVLLTGVVAGFANAPVLCSVLLTIASAMAAWSLNVFTRPVQAPKLQGIHPSFPIFIRAAYVWLLIAALLSIWAPLRDVNGGIGGASRHALTVGFLATMVFAIGQRVLPAFCGMHVLFSKRMMFFALALLNLGCLLRVVSEMPAYELNLPLAWRVLPVSAVIELTAVALFATNLVITFLRPPAHLTAARSAG